MNKKIKIILIIVFGIILVWFLIYLVSYFRFKDGKKPLITLKTNNYFYFDGTATEYESLGYKMIVYNRNSMNEKSFKLFGGSVINSTEDFMIIDRNSKDCNKNLYMFYEDDNYKYYFNCKKNYMFRFNDKEYKLEDALKNKMISVDTLEHILDVSKVEK